MTWDWDFDGIDSIVAFPVLLFTVICSMFITGSLTKPALVVAGLVGTALGVNMIGVRPVPTSQLQTFLKNLKVGAHRGLAHDAPENTIEAFKVCKTLGADSVEFDVEFTKDGVPVLMHDETVDRTTNGTGKVEELTWDHVRTLNAAAKFTSQNYTFVGVPRLTEAVEFCLEHGFKIFFDIKVFHPQLINTLRNLFQVHPELYHRSAVCSFDPRISYYVKKADPNVITAHTWRPHFMTYVDYEKTEPRFKNWLVRQTVGLMEGVYLWSLQRWLWKFTGADLILASNKAVSPDYMRKWKERGIAVIAWTVNDYAERLYYLKSLQCPFLTDKLSDFQSELKAFRPNVTDDAVQSVF